MKARIASHARGPRLTRTTSAIELAAVAHAGHQGREVVHRADEDHAHRDPQQRRQPAELPGGQDRPDDRAGRGDGAEVLAEQVERLGRHEVDAVLVRVGRGGGAVVERVLARDEAAVEPVAESEGHQDAGGQEGEGHGAS
jgi:hypothetical protein